MNKDDVIDSLGRIDDHVIQKENTARLSKHRKSGLRKVISWAACLALILGITLTAEASSGSVSNLLAPLFGMAQTELVDNIGVPVGVSASANGYTITADVVIGDRYNIAVVYTLSREDGQPLPENLMIDYEKKSGGSGGGWRGFEKNEEDPSKRTEICKHLQALSVLGQPRHR